MQEFTTTSKPLYLELLREIENMILSGICKENEKIPTSKTLSQKYSINTGTIQRSIHMLVQKGILVKKRGIGVFVCSHAYQAIYNERRNQFYTDYILPLAREAEKLGFSKKDIADLMDSANF